MVGLANANKRRLDKGNLKKCRKTTGSIYYL